MAKSKRRSSKRRVSFKKGGAPKSVKTYVKKEIRKLAAPIQIIRSMTYTNAVTPAATATVPMQLILNAGMFSAGANQNVMTALTGGAPYYAATTAHQFQDIKMKSLYLRMLMYAQRAIPFSVRFLLVYGKMTKGANISLNNVLDAADAVNSIYNYNAIDFHKRYRILWDKTMVISNQQAPTYATNDVSNSSLQAQPYHVHKRINLRDLTTNYALGNAGTFADIDDGHLSLFVITDSSTSLSIYINSILQYTDYQKADKR